jgi:hypothetical protein
MPLMDEHHAFLPPPEHRNSPIDLIAMYTGHRDEPASGNTPCVEKGGWGGRVSAGGRERHQPAR